MRTSILLFCIVVLGICLWLLLWKGKEHRAASPQETALATTNHLNQPIQPQAVENPQANAGNTPPVAVPPIRINTVSNREATLKQFQKKWQTPIVFYGEVVDQNTNPVSGAYINFDCNDLSPSGTSYYHSESDENGLFSIKDIQGLVLGVNVSKEGYYSYLPHGDNFFYAGKNQNFVPDANNPVVFHLWKKGQGEPLVGGSFPPGMTIAQLHHDGTPVELDLLNGTQVPAGSGQLKLELWRDISDMKKQPFDWKLQLSMPGGGLVPTDEEFAFQAPESGYQPSIVIDMPATNQNWLGEVRSKYYVQLPDGKYGRIDFYLLPYNGVFTVGSSINPSGSRDLEPK
jgi:hypothetical protein